MFIATNIELISPFVTKFPQHVSMFHQLHEETNERAVHPLRTTNRAALQFLGPKVTTGSRFRSFLLATQHPVLIPYE